MFWGGSRSTKPCAFPCKVAAGEDEKVPPVCGGCGCGRFGSSSVFCNKWLFLCASFYAFLESLVADRSGMAAWLLHGLCCGEEAGARNLVFFRVKWLQATMKWYLLCAAGAAAVVWVPPLCFATSGCSCVRSSMRFLNLWSQIAVEWLHDCRHLMLPHA